MTGLQTEEVCEVLLTQSRTSSQKIQRIVLVAQNRTANLDPDLLHTTPIQIARPADGETLRPLARNHAPLKHQLRTMTTMIPIDLSVDDVLAKTTTIPIAVMIGPGATLMMKGLGEEMNMMRGHVDGTMMIATTIGLVAGNHTMTGTTTGLAAGTTTTIDPAETGIVTTTECSEMGEMIG